MEEARRTIWQKLANCATERPEDRRNNWIATGLLLFWVITYVAAGLLIRTTPLPDGWPSYLVALVPIGVSVVAVMAYIRFILRADELLRKMQLEALAIGFGGGFVATFALDLAEKVGLGPFNIATPMMVMVVCWVIGFLAAARRYA